MKLKLFCIFLFPALMMASGVRSQNKEFIMGSVIGFYGIENTGDIKEMYPQSHGNISGTGGLSAGLNVRHDLSKNIYAALEIRYIRKGSIKTIITNDGSRSWEAIKLDYVEIPFLTGLTISTKKKPLFIETGFAYARLFSPRVSINSLNPWDSSAEQTHFKKNDISWVAGLKFPIIKSRKLLAGLRFSHSLFTIHSFCKLYNMDYGVEFYYLFNRNMK